VPIFSLHGEMPASEQDEAVGQSARPKIIVATNVAETSLTIDGVTLVVDSGLARMAEYDSRRGINTLLIEKISQASAEQRAGRAGRTRPGVCCRLWTQRDHERRSRREEPEVRRLDLSETLLTLAAMGLTRVEDFPWLDAPHPEAVERAVWLLRDLGALTESGELTPLGRRLVAFPLHPRYARLLLEAERWKCVPTAALLAALTQGRSILTRVDRRTEEERLEVFGGCNSDFGLLVRAFRYAKRQNFRMEACRRMGIHAEACRQVERAAEQFLGVARKAGLDLTEEPLTDEGLARCILAGFADQVGRRRHSGTLIYDLVHGRRGQLPKSSLAAEADWVVVAEVAEIGQGSGEVRMQLGLATAVELPWLREMFPGDFSTSEEYLYEASQKRVVRQKRVIFRDLILEASSVDAEPGARTAACLAAEVRAGRIVANGWNEAAESWIERVNFVVAACPEAGLSSIGAEERDLLLEQFCEEATCARDLREKPALPVLQSWLRPEQHHLLERLAPARFALPGGKSCRIHYSGNGEARAAVRMQELYGVKQSLFVAGGKVPVTLEILAPNHRPVQVTNDLANFWRTTYLEIRPGLQRRYPKHHWSENPTEVGNQGGASTERKATGSHK
jgi:ATP-dependent helicase HrpB